MEYFKSKDKKIVCLLCRHYCQLKEGQSGICQVNKNENGKLKNLVHSHIAALNLDPVEKKPLYNFLPGTFTLSFGTVGCNFKCPFCQNHSISQTNIIDDSRKITPKMIVDLALKSGAKSISYTYNEPTIFYPFARDVGLIAKKEGLKNIFVTNGFESIEVCDDLKEWLDAANIDLKSFNDSIYKKELKGGLEGVKDTIKRMYKSGIWIEVTTLIVPGMNDSKDEIENIAKFLCNELSDRVPLHLSAFYPNYKMLNKDPTDPSVVLKAIEIAKKVGLKYVYSGNIAIDIPTNCPTCNSELITRRGFRVLKNLIKNGTCYVCNTKIDGIF